MSNMLVQSLGSYSAKYNSDSSDEKEMILKQNMDV